MNDETAAVPQKTVAESPSRRDMVLTKRSRVLVRRTYGGLRGATFSGKVNMVQNYGTESFVAIDCFLNELFMKG